MLEYVVVDAFSQQPLHGNPAAVVFGGEHLNPEVMQRIAQEMNLSETVFVLPADRQDADYAVRIFTPASELPFAGHPTLAAAHAVLSRRSDAPATLLQSCALGLIPLRITAEGPERGFIEMTQGRPAFDYPGLTPARLAEALGCEAAAFTEAKPAVVSTGAPWLLAELTGPEALAGLAPNAISLAPLCKDLGALGVTLFCASPNRRGAAMRLRTFAPGEGIGEDPVCGSGHGAVCAYLARRSGAASGHYLAEQGVELGRRGTVRARWTREPDGLAIHIGGFATIVAEGRLHL